MTPAYDACPWCGAKAVDVTVLGDRIPRFICVGDTCHEWREGEGPEIQSARPSLFRRLLTRLSA